ncbi:MAG: lipase [Pirellulaceae bacterium]|nr:lipase [Pirellulaceae bacterium]
MTSQQRFNLKLPTWGGKQFWTDHHWRRGWRIQQNAVTQHWRLLDADNVRWAWGRHEQCRQALERLVPDRTVQSSQIVILLHGLMRSAASMRGLAERLTNQLQCQCVCFEYASTRHPVSHHAAALAEVVAGLPTELPLHFVGHSLGNIVVRYFWGDLIRHQDPATVDRIRSVVMLGPPNQGASIAKQLSRTGLFGLVAGPAGMELGSRWQSFVARLATPTCPFGIIAGRLPEALPLNPLVDGQGDFVVSVDETKLEGATDMLEVPVLHSFLMDSSDVQAAVARFIRTGHFGVSER